MEHEIVGNGVRRLLNKMQVPILNTLCILLGEGGRA